MSLAHDREQAVIAFQRAVTLDPRFAYAYLLLGHELTECGHFDRAVQVSTVQLMLMKRLINRLFEDRFASVPTNSGAISVLE
jgi:hypothetical protein